ncbi:MAG: TIM barrel protein [Chitinophagaceae bacterium]
MVKKIFLLTLVISGAIQNGIAQKIKNAFFPLHNIIRGDSTYDTFYKQVNLVKSTGFDAIEINGLENFEGMKAALEKFRFPASYFYVRINLDEPYFESRLEGYIKQLKGSGTIISPYIVNKAKFVKGDHAADTLVKRLMRQVADWARNANLQVAIYPHLGYYVERTDHALTLIKSINRKNLGLTFNLCHWLATTSIAERKELKSTLRELRPFLKMITINGANDVISEKQNVWADYILPLGTGNFDTYGLLKYCLKDLQLTVPVGVQCYNIQTDKYRLVLTTMSVLKEYRQRLEAGN